MNDEPIAWIQKASIEGLIKTKAKHFIYHCGVIQRKNQEYPIPLYTHPKEWVGLTNEEFQYCVELKNLEAIVEEVEAKLKQKNIKEMNNGSTN
jgi:hypothetical protein